VKQNLWLLALAVLAAGLALVYFLRPQAVDPVPAAAPVAAVPVPAPAAPQPLPGVVPHPAQTKAGLEPIPYQKGLARMRQGLPTLPAQAALRGRPGAFDGPPVDLAGQDPLPPGLGTEELRDLQGRFSLRVPQGWRAEPGRNPGEGPALTLLPPADLAGVEAAIYWSAIPLAKPETFFQTLLGAVRIRGERLVSARKVVDGGPEAWELISEKGEPGAEVLQRSYYVLRGQRVLQALVRGPKAVVEAQRGSLWEIGRSLRHEG